MTAFQNFGALTLKNDDEDDDNDDAYATAQTLRSPSSVSVSSCIPRVCGSTAVDPSRRGVSCSHAGDM